MPSEKLRNYINGRYNSLKKQLPKLIDVEFTSMSYELMDIPDGSIVYCDPPYKNTLKYVYDFDHEKFYNWCEKLSKRCRVYISEYSMPETRFECIKEVQCSKSLGINSLNHYTEKLYIVKHQYYIPNQYEQS